MKFLLNNKYHILFMLLIGLSTASRSAAQSWIPTFTRPYPCLNEYFTSINVYGTGVTGAGITASSCTDPYHNDETTSITAYPGALIKVDVSRFTSAFPGPGGYTAYLSMFADWNGDLSFDTLTERVGHVIELSPTTLTATDSFYAPCTPAVGVFFRIMLSEKTGNFTAPDTVSYGEVHDLRLQVPCATPAPVEGPTLVCVGDTITLTDAVSCGTWYSYDPDIASVSATGRVIGMAAGVTAIAYTTCGVEVYGIVSVSPFPITGNPYLCIGHSKSFESATPGGIWTIPPPVAYIHPWSGSGSGSGTDVMGNAAGTDTLTYIAPDGCSTHREVYVEPTMPIIGGSQVCIGYDLNLSVATIYSGGNWISSNSAVAAVSIYGGVVHGVAAGTATITWETGGGCLSYKVVEVDALPEIASSITVICQGAPFTLSATPSGGVWSSSNTAVATVSSGGVVSSLTAGTTTISYTMAGMCYTVRNITVEPALPVITGGASMCVAWPIHVTAVPGGGTWYSSDPSVASINSSDGWVTGHTVGTTIISYVSLCGASTTRVLYCHEMPVITGGTSVCRDATLALSATPAGGSWTSSAPAVATVNGSSGVVTGVAGGTATITNISSSGCSSSQSITVNVGPTVSGSSDICVGSFCLVSASPPVLTYGSSNTGVATMLDIGTGSYRIVGVSAGTATISFTNSLCTTAHHMTINPTPIITTGPTTLCPGAPVTFSATPSGGHWGSDNTSIVTITYTGGVASYAGNGWTNLNYTSPAGCYGGGYAVTSGASISLSGASSIDICYGSTVTYTGTPSGGHWLSGNTSIATIGYSTGEASAVGGGSTLITYTSGACTITENVAIKPLPGGHRCWANSTGTGFTTGGADIHVTAGGSIDMWETELGGTWMSGNSAVAEASLPADQHNIFSVPCYITMCKKTKIDWVSTGTVNIYYVGSNGCSISFEVTCD
jgi:uncharacterized protein YjdB